MLKYYQVVAKTTSVCGWTIKANSAKEARMLAANGPDYSALDFDEPDGFDICTVKVKESTPILPCEGNRDG